MMQRLLVLSIAATLSMQAADADYFEKKIRPLFVAKCQSCHGAKVRMAGLSLASKTGMEKGSDNGAVVVKGDASQSKLFAALTYAERVKMPPTGKLAADEIDAVKTWIESGAVWPEEKTVVTETAGPKKWTLDRDKLPWAFQPVKPVAVPQVRNTAWVKNPIDRFVLAKLEEKKLAPAPAASKLALLRRVTYDLTGLPPDVKEIEEFLADNSADAFAKVVDRLLASPRYGERWGRHWLDVARYADSTGMDEDHIYPYAWRYRDYVVRAFQNDLPFDAFIKEQIAGDLMPGTERKEQRVVATGFLALGPKPLAQQDRIKMIYDVVDEQIDTVSKAFLGVTVACARCHDHKFDPILTKDYYGLASVFASTLSFRSLGRPGSVSYIYYAPLDEAAYGVYQSHRWRVFSKRIEMEEAMSEDLVREGALLRPKMAAYITAAWKVRQDKTTLQAATNDAGLEQKRLEHWIAWLAVHKDKDFVKKWNEATQDNIAAIATEYQDAFAKSATAWETQLANWRRRYATEVAADRDVPARPKLEEMDNPFFAAASDKGGPMELADTLRVAQLRRELQQLEKTQPKEPAMASAVCDGPVADQHVFVRGDHLSPGEPVAKHFPLALSGAEDANVKTGSGRLELANWLSDAKNPLTARVVVNRVWQWHFGEALMRTPNNWGVTGDKTLHPELIDYLAKAFVDNGWSIKALHRMILLSNTYQMSASVSAQAKELDAGNRLFSRFPRARMSVEQIRDSILFLSGNLDPAIGGSLLDAQKGKRQKVDPDDLKRRTMYIPVRRGSIPTVLATFDYGDATTSSEGRARTNVAPQALFLMNSKFAIERSKEFATRVLAGEGTDAEKLKRAYLMSLTRPPEPSEIDDALSYIAQMEKRLNENGRSQAWQSFCHILLSSNEFMYLN